MIVRPPPRAGFRLFRPPSRQVVSDDPRNGAGYFDGVWWTFGPAPVPDEPFERALADATLEYYRGDYERALAILDGIEAQPTTKGKRADIDQARMEILVVMGRFADGRDALRAMLSMPRSIGQFVRRMWLYAVESELGDVAAASDELAWLESDEHATSEIGVMMMGILPRFLGFLGDLERAERHLVRWIKAASAIGIDVGEVEPWVRGTINLATQGANPISAEAWGVGLGDRLTRAIADGGEG